MSEIFFNSPSSEPSLESQIENFQTTLASLNQQIIILRENLQEKDQKIAELETRLSEVSPIQPGELKTDKTLTIIDVLINLYQYIFPPGKAEQ